MRTIHILSSYTTQRIRCKATCVGGGTKNERTSNHHILLHEHSLSTNAITMGTFWKLNLMHSTSNRGNEITACDSSKWPNNSAIKHATPQSEVRITVSYLTRWSVCWLNISCSSKWATSFYGQLWLTLCTEQAYTLPGKEEAPEWILIF